MKISFNWLKNYLPISVHAEEVAQLLTQSGLEVTAITKFLPIDAHLEGLIIGQVIGCKQHPNADKLKITLVDVGQPTPLHIVCGAPNVRTDQKVVLAPIGTQLINQAGTKITIKKAKIRGEISEGMLCAENEIGLGHTHEGIIVLNTHLPPGTPARQHFGSQPDTIFEIDLTPNRGDACSHLGIARELGALLDLTVQYPDVAASKIEETCPPIQIEVQDPMACPRYSGIMIKGVKVQPSPPWLSNKLRAMGLSTINNIVDITNFVMHELGQPLHAFDYDQIVGKNVILKQLAKNTTFTTLENVTKQLHGTELMICDEAGGIGMAGIIGSKRTNIQASTQNVFLESAYFTPSSIRKTAQQHSIQTDASFRYERGTDPNLTVYALKRACLLIQSIAQSEIASSLIDLYPKKIAAFNVKVSYKQIKKILGQTIPQQLIKKILNKLEIGISHEEPNSFVALVPPYHVNIKREIDVIEAIARIYSYDRIKVTGKLGSTYLARPLKLTNNATRNNISALLASNGYHEIYTNSLTKSAYTSLTDTPDKQQTVLLSNPLSETLNILRQTLLFSGLEVIAHNINRKQLDLKLFEFGKTYHKIEKKYVEKNRLGIWLTGNMEAINWINQPHSVHFQAINALVYKILHKLGIIDFVTEHVQHAFYQKSIGMIKNQTDLLTAGEVHHTLLKYLHIEQAVFFVDINWDGLLSTQQTLSQYQKISKFPPVKRDISLVLDKSVNFEAVKRVILQQKNRLIQHFTVFDVYENKALGPNKKAYALRFLLQDKEKTLEEKTIDQVIISTMRTLKDQLGAFIRE